MFADAITNRLMARVFALVLASVLMAWVFAYLRTSDSPAGARSGGVSGRGVNWKNGPTKLGILQRDGPHLIHSHPLSELMILKRGGKAVFVVAEEVHERSFDLRSFRIRPGVTRATRAAQDVDHAACKFPTGGEEFRAKMVVEL